MHSFGPFKRSVTHWINNDFITDEGKFAAACEAIYPRDGSGNRTVEICFNTPERPGHVKVTFLSREPSDLMDELRTKGGDNGLKPEVVQVEVENEETTK
ncbi:hypothetical protein FSPOR_3024 [Fusarium sporotrichioides]|uniref:Uncharacterized protein n=1 Tax=Fusarium sporotrichioides TaxID=5514 RepID=A0A395SIL5_FUSSP|nr:hypothetical protein FSPOR_3024 [Fusarium sporotrichioides]